MKRIKKESISGINSELKEEVVNSKEFEDTTKIKTKKSKRKVVIISLCSLIALVFSIVVVVIFIRKNSHAVETDITNSGLYCINNWVDSVHSLSNLSYESYLGKELDYANGDTGIKTFMLKVAGTISYIPDSVEAFNKYGYPMYNKLGERIYTDSLVNSNGEEVDIRYIDYSRINLNNEEISKIVKEMKISTSSADYKYKLISAFCKYINSLDSSDLPLKRDSELPNLVKGADGSYSMTIDEDIRIDKLLFSSEDFYSLMGKFSSQVGSILDGVEPDKTNSRLFMPTDWCGVYSKSSDIVVPIGDGTKSNPAGEGTWIFTSVFVTEGSDRVSYPIRVRFVGLKQSSDAIKLFESKDERNRGYDPKSLIQYISYNIEIENVSDRTLIIRDNSTLCDGSANTAPKTGTVYGLKDVITLKPNEIGVIESWGSSTEIDTKYLIWGKDFQRLIEPVWFRCLKGNTN